jgi:phosphonate transport system substrate-binding protein
VVVAVASAGCGEASPTAASPAAGGGGPAAGAAKPAPAAPKTRDPETLRVALLPDENASKLIQDNQGLKAYLEKELGKKVELHVLTSYAAMVEATRNKHLDLCYFGPLSYCIAKDRCDIECFAAKLKNGVTTYESVVIASVESGITKVEEIRGKRMAYGDQASTSSHLIPKGVLAKHGVKPGDYQESFLGKHDAVALNVMRGNVDAGGLSKPILEGLLEKGTVDRAKVRVIAVSDPIPDYPWAMQSDLDPALKAKVRAAFHGIKDKEILKPLKADGFAPMEDRSYDVIRNAAKILNLDLGKLEQ